MLKEAYEIHSASEKILHDMVGRNVPVFTSHIQQFADASEIHYRVMDIPDFFGRSHTWLVFDVNYKSMVWAALQTKYRVDLAQVWYGLKFYLAMIRSDTEAAMNLMADDQAFSIGMISYDKLCRGEIWKN